MTSFTPDPNKQVLQVDLEFMDILSAEAAKLGLKRNDIIYEMSLGLHLMYVGNGDFVIKNPI